MIHDSDFGKFVKACYKTVQPGKKTEILYRSLLFAVRRRKLCQTIFPAVLSKFLSP